MKLIIDFYKGLDTLNLIIFWGIIIVIILLLIFSCILINKNKKLKKIVEKNRIKYEEELPIKKETEPILIKEPETKNILPEAKEEIKTNEHELIETEKKFVVEEHIMEYNKEEIKKNNEYNKSNRVIDIKPSIEIPRVPYQKNVLREMSLSQTSPIGINRQENQNDKKIEMAKDLEESLKNNYNETKIKTEETKVENRNDYKEELPKKIKEENNLPENDYPAKIETKNEYSPRDELILDEKMLETTNDIKNIDVEKYDNEKKSSEKYLEEVSRKLAEAEIPDDIERTNYELQQEEDAIISYKELMEKKDSIQTVDEEDAIISIEELMERSNQKQEEKNKLYNITDEEENDNFINELKQFRNDL